MRVEGDPALAGMSDRAQRTAGASYAGRRDTGEITAERREWRFQHLLEADDLVFSFSECSTKVSHRFRSAGGPCRSE